MYIVFYSASDVFRAEEILNEEKIECAIVPSPVEDKVYCGMCIETAEERAPSLMDEDMEFSVF